MVEVVVEVVVVIIAKQQVSQLNPYNKLFQPLQPIQPFQLIINYSAEAWKLNAAFVPSCWSGFPWLVQGLVQEDG